MYRIYLCYFAAEGIIYPFWPTWLKSLGYSNGEVGLFIAAAYWPQVFVGFALTYLADRRFGQLQLAASAAVLSALCMSLHYLPQNTALYLLLGILYGGLWTTVLPLGEAYLLTQDKAAIHDYGRVRAAGSLAFVLMSVLGGSLLDYFGQPLVPGLVTFFMLCTALACFSLLARTPHAAPVRSVASGLRPDWRQLGHHRLLLMAIGAAGLIQLSHCLYFSTASNSWAAQGYSTTQIGAFWAIAVVAEISYFALSGAVLNRLSPLPVIMLSGFCAALRWGLSALGGGLMLIILGQLLHALSFAAYHSALMRYIRDNAPEGMNTFTQGLYYSLAVALPMGIATPLAGWLFDINPGWAYLGMTLIALGGSLAAYLAHLRTRMSDDAKTLFSRLF